jgi:hypothetical protein
VVVLVEGIVLGVQLVLGVVVQPLDVAGGCVAHMAAA